MAEASAKGSPYCRTIVGTISIASGRTTNSWCSVPNNSATWRACSSSSKALLSKPIEKVLTGEVLASAIAATTADESMPPERNAPRGTSAIIRRCVAARRCSRIGSCNSRGSVTASLRA